MKRIALLIVGLLVVGGVACAQPYTIQFKSKACETNVTAATTYTPDNDSPISGYVDTIIIDQTGVATGSLSLVTLASQGTGAARTVLTDTTMSADGSYPVRDVVTTQAGADIANTPARIPLVGDKLRLTLYNYGATNITTSVWVVITPDI